jgi:hypothetical protein
VDECRAAIAFYLGAESSSSSGRVDAVQAEIRESLRASPKSVGMLAVWRDKGSPTTRRGLCIAVVLGLCMAFCGVAGELNCIQITIIEKFGDDNIQSDTIDKYNL